MNTELRIAAYVAARLAGVPATRHGEYFHDSLGVAVSGQQAERAVAPIRESSPWKGERGRPGARKPKRAPLLRDWLVVDELRVGLEKSLVKVEGDGRHDASLVRSLERMPGVRQLLELGTRRDLLMVILTRDRAERDALRARIAEFTDRPIFWDEVLVETHRPAEGTWASLARRIAAEQDALSDGPSSDPTPRQVPLPRSP